MSTDQANEGGAIPRGRAGATFAGSISFQNVGFRAGNVQVLDDISLTFEAGKVSCLLGPSGCGKTTLLRLAAGVAKPSRGRIFIENEEVAGPAVFVAPEKRNVGLMFQDYALFPHLSVLQNVCFGLTAISASEAKIAALNALERVGLADKAQRFPNRLSGGEQQRVALARAIVPRPQVILMDEPFSGLDQRLRDQVRADTLDIVRETRATAVIVTHDPMEAIEVADRIFLMRTGSLVQQGTPQELYGSPVDEGAAQFFAHHNELRGVSRAGTVQTAIGPIAATSQPEGTRLTVLIKPSAIKSAEQFEKLPIKFNAYVRDVRFVGEAQRLSLAVEGLESLFTAELAIDEPVAVGTLRSFVINPSGVFVFTSR
jgi:iron(III) transport system ATP-binding protein